MAILIFKIIYYIGLAVFCIVSLLALRQMNRFSYLGRAIRPIMVLYVLVSLTFIVFIQLYMTNIDWDQSLFGRSVPSFSSYKNLDTSMSESSGGIIDFVRTFRFAQEP